MLEINPNIYSINAFALKVAAKFLNIPKPLLFTGVDSSRELVQFIIDSGAKAPLIVTDEQLIKLGLIAPFITQLEDAGLDVSVFSEITPDPGEALILQGIDKARSANADVVLTIGGGSAIDAAKMIAALAPKNGIGLNQISRCKGMLKIWQKGLPLYVVPTTAGTGSEATMAAVISKHDGQKYPVVSPAISADAAAIDGKLMTGLPAPLTAATGMDALTHAIEAFTSKNASKETDSYAIAATKLIFENLEACVEQGDNVGARQKMALASTYAGLAFNKAGVGYVHAIAHQLGAFYHIPHGLANAMVLPTIVELNLAASEQRLALLAKAIGLQATNDTQLAQDFLDAVVNLCAKLGIPSKVEKLRLEDCPVIAKAALKEAHFLYAVPKYINEQQCIELLESLLVSN